MLFFNYVSKITTRSHILFAQHQKIGKSSRCDSNDQFSDFLFDVELINDLLKNDKTSSLYFSLFAPLTNMCRHTSFQLFFGVTDGDDLSVPASLRDTLKHSDFFLVVLLCIVPKNDFQYGTFLQETPMWRSAAPKGIFISWLKKQKAGTERHTDGSERLFKVAKEKHSVVICRPAWPTHFLAITCQHLRLPGGYRGGGGERRVR